MVLHIYDTRRRAVVPFEPVRGNAVGIYVCGPTVQAAPHVGHVRSAVAFDVLRRWLTASGYDVTFIRNVTDIDDKILHEAGHEAIPWWALAERNTRAFTQAYDALNVLPPTGEPRATGHVLEMTALIGALVDKGYAYPSGGDVYFDVRRFADYGSLSNQRPDAMQPTEQSELAKRDPLDFALWKGAKPGEPSWPTPWGAGRPGWHLECSAMATRYLGDEFDIHGGGLDLVFPHHENELAQSSAAGHAFARYWMHNGLVSTGGEKMSKSLGNSLVVADVLQRTTRQALRYYLGAPHYRSTLDWTEDGLADAAAAYERVDTFVTNAVDALGDLADAEARGAADADDEPADRWGEFAAAMDDDLAVPRALGVVHGCVRAGNAVLADEQRRGELARWLAVTRRMLEVLALDPVAQWPQRADSDLLSVVDTLVGVALRAREDARARREFSAADAIRDALAAAGVVVEDTPARARWRLSG